MSFGYSDACQSGFAYVDESDDVVCAAAPVSPRQLGLPILCSPGEICTDMTGAYNNSCSCGFSGYGYCPLYLGDLGYLTLAISYFKKIIGKVSCYNNVFTELCVMYDSEFLYYYYMYYVNMEKLTVLGDAGLVDTNVLQTFAGGYFTATQYIDSYDASSSSNALILAILGFAYLV